MKTPPQKGKRIAAIDWLRGLEMILMIDHVSMAFNGAHFSSDSAEQLVRLFSRAQTKRVTDLLKTLATLGQAQRMHSRRYTSG